MNQTGDLYWICYPKTPLNDGYQTLNKKLSDRHDGFQQNRLKDQKLRFASITNKQNVILIPYIEY